ncbi:MAG: HIT family protein [Candidatus Magasanikbacteria bacterium]|jgi:histidine triad (HIT) family protein|nr:HIT family protein [Candidatus Magasanikbacteria bacterium]
MEETIFHKILAGEIPAHKVYEDEHVLAFLDIFPLAKGHTLVVPKVFGETLLDLSAETISSLWQGVQHATKKIKEVLSPEGFTFGVNHGEVAGQSVPYVHVHIIPRWADDNGGSMHSIVKNPPSESIEEIAALFT